MLKDAFKRKHVCEKYFRTRKVRYKPRKQIKELKAIDKRIYIDRTYEDFIEYTSLNPI